MKKNSINKVYFVTFFLFLFDFISKNIVIKKLPLLKSIDLIPNFFYLTYVQNTGAAWGILKDNSIILALLSLIIFIFISNYIKKLSNLSNLGILGFSLVLGGILGNFIDRVLYGYVIDFLDFRIFGYDYPIFNMADIMIVVGIIMVIICAIRGDINESSSRKK